MTEPLKIHSRKLTVTDVSLLVLTYSAVIFNDGASDVYILDEEREISANDAPLKAGEHLPVSMDKPGESYHWLRVSTGGSACVRIFSLR